MKKLIKCIHWKIRNLSDHNAFTTEINLNQRLIETRSDDKVKYAFKRADWSAINTTIINNPFTPFCCVRNLSCPAEKVSTKLGSNQLVSAN